MAVDGEVQEIQQLDELDRKLLALLIEDAGRSNKALAQAAGIAESTCLYRVRSLRSRGVIAGIHAVVDPERLGLGVVAMVFVRFRAQRKAEFSAWREEISQLPGVIAGYHLSGAYDYLVHVAAASPDVLRDYILDHLSNAPGVARVETSLVFDSVRGPSLS